MVWRVAADCQACTPGLAVWPLQSPHSPGHPVRCSPLLPRPRVLACRCEDPSFLSPYLRVSYSAASDEAIEEGFRRVGAVLRRRRTAAATAAVHGPPVAPAPAVPAEGSPGRPAAMVRGDSAYGGAATVWGHAGRPQLRRV